MPICKVLDVGEDRYTAPWASNAYAIHNGYRMALHPNGAKACSTMY
ncbi:hypothetical protein N7V09_21325 [Shewanella seohaensis]|nr:hypothetical protein [Shewanella seohaensis]UXM82143.1 hypothetical protein N7V09_21325 [Shewanella seohaensis]